MGCADVATGRGEPSLRSLKEQAASAFLFTLPFFNKRKHGLFEIYVEGFACIFHLYNI
ncbi:hypothetical protein [Cytobacillus gottheilii]|uniref:hypothetical protein n=1 Tax=Cytobacillus gottheilii TaxID=859144 RepID=UPI001C5964FB|nr:hypothetical protein [Cytobacillus gottheilii]